MNEAIESLAITMHLGFPFTFTCPPKPLGAGRRNDALRRAGTIHACLPVGRDTVTVLIGERIPEEMKGEWN